MLKVEFLNLGPLDGDEWGFTGTFAKENGGGFLTDHFPKVRILHSTHVHILCVGVSVCTSSIFIYRPPKLAGISKASGAPADTSQVRFDLIV